MATLLINDYLALSKEAGRRHADVREAAEKAHQLLKLDKDQAFLQLRAEPALSPKPLYHPIFLASQTRNPKVIALAVSALQRLITAGAVTPVRRTSSLVVPTVTDLVTAGIGTANPRNPRAGHSARSRDSTKDSTNSRRSPHHECRRDSFQ